MLVAVNKMDLISYEEGAFRAIEEDFRAALEQIATDTGNPVEATFVPVSALKGDNVVHRAARASGAMPWYEGPPLLRLAGILPSTRDTRNAPFRFAVQRVLRPDHTFRGFAGQIASGSIHTGNEIRVFPSGRSAKIERIVTFDGDLGEAAAPLSVTLVLDRELDVSRGDLIAGAGAAPKVARNVKAAVVWMDQRSLEQNRRYLLKHTSQTLPVFVSSIDYRVNLGTLKREPTNTLHMNDIGAVSLRLLRPMAVDLHHENRATGAFILIDPETNSTVAAGMITAARGSAIEGEDDETAAWGRVTAGEREARWGHRGGVLELAGPSRLIDAIERSLFAVGAATCRIDSESNIFLLDPSLLDSVTHMQTQSGLLALVVRSNEDGELRARAEGSEITLGASEATRAVTSVHQLLHRAGIFISIEKADL